MLHAILLNKAGRNITSNEIHWRQLFTASEDSLTSTIFGTLLYLPVELFWQIINNACYFDSISNSTPKILFVEFWPHWKATNSFNTNFIEPDVFIRTSEFDLIIEAKRYDNNQQSKSQWEKEFQGYLNEYSNDNKKVILLAIGGISNELPESIENEKGRITIIKCRWSRVLTEIKSVHSNLEKNKSHLSVIDSTLLILSDIIKGFGIHGYSTGEWFEDQNFTTIGKISTSNLKQLLQF